MELIPISVGHHSGKRWRRPENCGFAARQALVVLAGAEFARAASSMPIAFLEQTGRYLPVAIMSPQPDRNLFVGPAGQWLGAYIPAILRSYPFCLGRVKGSSEVALCIDADSRLIVDTQGEDFFDAEGNLSPATKAIQEFLTRVERDRVATDMAVASLAAAGLIRSWTVETTAGGPSAPLSGLYRIDEVALQGLDDEAFCRLRKPGALPLAYMQLMSMGQVAVFERLKLIQQQLVQAHQKIQLPSLDEIFSGEDEKLRFN